MFPLSDKPHSLITCSNFFIQCFGTAIQNGMKFAVKRNCKQFCVAYSGHGQANTGHWVFSDGVVTLEHILHLFLRTVPTTDGWYLYHPSSHVSAITRPSSRFSWPVSVTSFPVCIQFAPRLLKAWACWGSISIFRRSLAMWISMMF